MNLKTQYVTHLDIFESTGHLRGKARTYEAVKEAVLQDGEFSIFEATFPPRNAHLFEQLIKDPEIETFDKPFPWIGIRRR